MNTAHAAPTTRRIAALDALRGFALCGIIFINIPQTMDMMHNLSESPLGIRLFVLGRFYPIFYLLFGLGFGLFLRSAVRRGATRLPMVRRLLMLGGLGGLHHLLQPGEVLLPFAITGLLVLLPLSYAPVKVNLVVGPVLTVVGVLIGVGGFGVLPGLFVLGFALAQGGFADSLERLGTMLVGALATCAIIAIACYLAVIAKPDELIGRWLGLTFSMAMAAGYAAAFLLLLRSPAGPVLSAIFAPLGRMALTNYLTATVLFVTIGAHDWATVGLLGGGILLVQAVWSPLWLSRFGYGPLEWAWRTVTYWQRIPIRKAQ